MTKKKLKVISLFSGSGGLDLGFLNTNKYQIIFANDFCKDACLTYSNNINKHIICDDIANIQNIPIADIVIGGPPCQGFSLGNPNRMMDDPRNWLFKEYVRILKQSKAIAFIFENVSGIRTLANGELYNIIKNEFDKMGYTIYDDILNAADYNVPQHRKRNFIIGIKNNIDTIFNFPEKQTTKYLTVKDALLKPHIPKNISNHEFSRLTPLNIERLSYIPPGGSMKDVPRHLQNNSDLKRAMRRLSFEETSPTIVHNNCDHYYHPIEPRRITIREMARIQTYPDQFIFTGSKSAQSIQVANSVPIKLAEILAYTLYNTLTSKY